MKNEAILLREHAERETYQKVGSVGRSALSDEALLIPPDTVMRYRAAADGARIRTPLEQMIAWAAPLEGKTILEICGHDGEYAAILALLGATVYTVDIAQPLVWQAQRRAEMNEVTDRMHPVVMSVHEMDFPDDTFDVVFGKAALHHLDLSAAGKECHRVLKPGGVGIFSEPIMFSSFLQALRPYVPVAINRESPDERQLSQEDLTAFCAPYSQQEFAYFRLLSRLGRVLPAVALPLSSSDRWLMEKFPALKNWSGNCAFKLTK